MEDVLRWLRLPHHSVYIFLNRPRLRRDQRHMSLGRSRVKRQIDKTQRELSRKKFPAKIP
jgi:hypothetical protein